MAAATLRDPAQKSKQWVQYLLSSGLSSCEARAIYTILILVSSCRQLPRNLAWPVEERSCFTRVPGGSDVRCPSQRPTEL
ncbi:hypothetical protein PRBEI_2001542600 [Prionailurus iriomotensis]